MIEFNKHLYLNFSNRKNGMTSKMIDSEKQGYDSEVVFVGDFIECKNCMRCSDKGKCPLKDSEKFEELVEIIRGSEHVHFCVPVYLNMPTAKTLSLLSRLSMMNNDFYKREMFIGNQAYIHVIADVSGTQSVGNMLLGALNMLSFTIPPRAVKEYVRNWQDSKIRGGSLTDVRYIKDENFKTTSEKENKNV